MPQTRQFRSMLAAVLLAAVPATAALIARGTEKPWTPQSPAYRQAGPADAPAVLVEFGDFQCPPCGYAAPIVRQLEARYGSKLHIIFKHRPWLDMHHWAKDSALAAECAGKQGKFWEMYDALFSKQSEWAESKDAPEAFEKMAASLKLDLPEYHRCLADPATFAAIQSDLKDADDHWVNSTPTFFVNGRRLVGGTQLRTIGANEIERSLGK